MRYIHHTLNELAKATTVLETGAVFDPTAAARVSVVSQSVSRTGKTEPEKVM